MSDISKKEEDIEKALLNYEKQTIGLPELRKVEASEYLNMSLEDLRKKDPSELSEACFQISQYSFYIQRLINKNNAWIKWAKSKIEELASDYLKDVPDRYGSYERTMIARHKPELCKNINAFLRRITMENELMAGVPDNLQKMSECIRDIKFSKLRQEKEYARSE